jgi:hypothetical protein
MLELTQTSLYLKIDFKVSFIPPGIMNHKGKGMGWGRSLLLVGYICIGSYCVGNLSPAMGARNQVGIGLSYRPASLCSLATQFQTRFLESIPRPIAVLKFSTLSAINRKTKSQRKRGGGGDRGES